MKLTTLILVSIILLNCNSNSLENFELNKELQKTKNELRIVKKERDSIILKIKDCESWIEELEKPYYR